jgi:hypothetical protein
MSSHEATCPLTGREVVDDYFLEHRAKLIDIAAFLDRLDRARPTGDEGGVDFRVAALRRAIAILTEPAPGRAARILDLLSDPTNEPIASAAGMKGAHGAYPGEGRSSS